MLVGMVTLGFATPALAGADDDSSAPGGSARGTMVPEPADIGLFALGAAGLLIGRRTSRRHKQLADKTDA